LCKMTKIPSFALLVLLVAIWNPLSDVGAFTTPGGHQDNQEEVLESNKMLWAELTRNGELPSRRRGKAAKLPLSPWTGRRMKYFIDPVFNEEEKQKIKDAMDEIEEDTEDCVRFDDLGSKSACQSQANCVHVTRNEPGYADCSASAGMIGGIQIMNLEETCFTRPHSKGYIIHELMHALGFEHTHTRPDRDSYVEIHLENIADQYAPSQSQREYVESNFKKKTESEIDVLGQDYDLLSIMHYPVWAFAKSGTRTIVPKNPVNQTTEPCDKIGQRCHLSPGDIQNIKELYKC